MKRSVFILGLGLMVLVAVFSQNNKKLSLSGASSDTSTDTTIEKAPTIGLPVLSGSAVRLENDSDRLVFFAVIPVKGGELSGMLDQPKLAVDRLRALREKLDYLAGGTVAPSITVTDGEQLILGFEVEAGISAYPIWYASIPPKAKRSGNNLYQLSTVKPLVDSQKQRVYLRPADFDLPATAIRIDGRFVDWLKFQDILTYQDRTTPLRIKRQTDSGSEEIALDASLSFRHGGTDIEHVRIVRNLNDILVMVSSHSVMSRGLSYLLRLYANDTETSNRFTLEIPVEGNGGPVLLWTSGKKEPLILGNYATADYYVEARFNIKMLPAGLSRLFSGNWMVEISSAWTDQAMSEDFFWGRFPAANIVKTD